ncbi:DUF2917 domain-containing protein [Bdellovibrio bacteriovorus]|uniref:DUF2917 domain-containing protein n=1 Tax=Bdellovibrio TaxID=958 RepID=UPI0035A9A0AA
MRKADHFQLLKGEIYTQSKQDIGITCLTGALWVTQPEEGRDIILSPGEYYWADKSKGKLVVEALNDSSLQVSGCKTPVEQHPMNLKKCIIPY